MQYYEDESFKATCEGSLLYFAVFLCATFYKAQLLRLETQLKNVGIVLSFKSDVAMPIAQWLFCYSNTKPYSMCMCFITLATSTGGLCLIQIEDRIKLVFILRTQWRSTRLITLWPTSFLCLCYSVAYTTQKAGNYTKLIWCSTQTRLVMAAMLNDGPFKPFQCVDIMVSASSP